MIDFFARFRDRVRPSRPHASRPVVEGLEDRFLLYATTGDSWVYPTRVTYSFVPDGTSVGGTPSNLFSTMNHYYSTSTWENIFAKAAASWEQAANVNLVQVSDNGVSVGSGSYQQGDPNLGDIRIGAIPEQSGELAFTFLPPPQNGGSAAGDIFFNSNINWSTSTGYDLMTVALHELGHALGMDHSTVTTAVMYANYNGVKDTLTSDDIAGIQSIYGAPVVGSNGSYTTATPVTLNGSDQAVVTGVDIASATNYNWFSVVVPSDTSGTLSITMQSSNLSSLEPRLTLFNSALHGLAMAGATTYGGTVSITLTGVTPGQLYYIRAGADVNGPGDAGAYGLNVNAGTGTMSAIAPPDTQVAATSNEVLTSEQLRVDPSYTTIATSRSHRLHTDGSLDGIGRHLMSNVTVVLSDRHHTHSTGRVLGQGTPSVSRHPSW